LEEAYAVTGNIKGKLATLQVTQQKLQIDSIGEVTEKTVEDEKQAAAQCTTKVVVIRVELDALHTKISMSTERLQDESRCFCWVPVGSKIPQGQFWG